mgnify:CR=1 FL=1
MRPADILEWDRLVLEDKTLTPHGRLVALGISHRRHVDHLNMTALALRGSRYHTGVSAVHGRVAAANEGYAMPYGKDPADRNNRLPYQLKNSPSTSRTGVPGQIMLISAMCSSWKG